MDYRTTSFEDLVAALASDAPTPGGGTAAALAGATGAALVEMVGALTLSKEKYAASHDAVRPIADEARRAREEFLRLAREDAESYEAVLAARRLPKTTDDDRALRAARITAANRVAAEVPLRTARTAAALLARLPVLAEKGNPNAASDAGAAALLLEAAAQAALLNVAINLGGTEDPGFAAPLTQEAERIAQDAARLREEILRAVR